MAFQGKLARRGKARREWRRKQKAAQATGARYYGDGGTIHATTGLDVEVHDGRVYAVWFRCQMLPFTQRDVDVRRAREMHDQPVTGNLTGVEIEG